MSSGAKSRYLRRDAEVYCAGLCVSRVERVSANYSRRLDSRVRLGATDGACSVDEWHGCLPSRVEISSLDIVSSSGLSRQSRLDSRSKSTPIPSNPFNLNYHRPTRQPAPTHTHDLTIMSVPPHLRLAVVLFPNAFPLDFVGPLDILGTLRAEKHDPPLSCSITTTLLSHSLDALPTSAGWDIVPQMTYETALSEKEKGKWDGVLVPGGQGARPWAEGNEAARGFLEAVVKDCKVVLTGECAIYLTVAGMRGSERDAERMCRVRDSQCHLARILIHQGSAIGASDEAGQQALTGLCTGSETPGDRHRTQLLHTSTHESNSPAHTNPSLYRKLAARTHWRAGRAKGNNQQVGIQAMRGESRLLSSCLCRRGYGRMDGKSSPCLPLAFK